MLKIVKKVLFTLMLSLVLVIPVQAATKTKALVIRGDFTWMTGKLEGVYSKGKFKYANVDYVYVYPGITNKKKGITERKDKYVSGFIQGTLAGETKQAKGTIRI